jgi:hypothetical protein
MTILAVLLEMGFNSLGVLKVLAVAGGAGAGGLASGLLGQLLSRSLTTQKMHPKLLTGTRLGGAGIGGWLVALWVFGGGGEGIGGGGGFGLGAGNGPDTPAATSKDTRRPDSSDRPGTEESSGARLRVEVLGPDTLVKITHKERPDRDRCYRVDDPEGARLCTLAEIKDLIKQRRKQWPPLRNLDIVVYKDSPDEGVSYVREFSRWAQDQESADARLMVTILKPDKNAPVR